MNIRGSSLTSADGNGAIILTNPDSPLNLQNDADVTTGSMIGLKWTEGVDNGGSAVIDYKISYTTGANPYVTLDTGIAQLSYEAINLISG